MSGWVDMSDINPYVNQGRPPEKVHDQLWSMYRKSTKSFNEYVFLSIYIREALAKAYKEGYDKGKRSSNK